MKGLVDRSNIGGWEDEVVPTVASVGRDTLEHDMEAVFGTLQVRRLHPNMSLVFLTYYISDKEHKQTLLTPTRA